MNSILLFGCGQLGSRYLQGFARCGLRLSITVVDPSALSIRRAQSRWTEAGGDLTKHTVRWAKSLPDDLRQVDVAIIAMPSRDRSKIVQSIANRVAVENWILEKVLAQSSSELLTINKRTAGSKGAWVNIPRRIMAWHRALRNEFSDQGVATVSYSATNWGLACNSIHFIDLVSWLSGRRLLSISADRLDKKWFASKRSGYFEITGELFCEFESGVSLRLNSFKEAQAQVFVVTLRDGVIWTIDESAGTAHGSNGKVCNGRLAYQSELSAGLVESILERGSCDLPTLSESSAMHSIFLESMLGHWNSSQGRADKSIPVT